MAGRAEADSEGRVVDAPVHPPTSFRPEAIGRGRLSGGQVLVRLQNDLQGEEGSPKTWVCHGYTHVAF